MTFRGSFLAHHSRPPVASQKQHHLKSAIAVGPVLNTLIYFLVDNEDIAKRELDMTTAQLEWIAQAEGIGRAPLPTSPDWQRNPVDKLQFLMFESHFQFRQQSFVREDSHGVKGDAGDPGDYRSQRRSPPRRPERHKK